MLKDKKSRYLFVISIIALLVLFLAGLFWFFKVVPLRPSSPRHLLIPSLSVRSDGRHLGINDIGTIETWMTFDYLNKAFNLPPDYLKNSLQINNSRYPFLTINRYSRSQKNSATSTLLLMQKAIVSYLKP